MSHVPRVLSSLCNYPWLAREVPAPGKSSQAFQILLGSHSTPTRSALLSLSWGSSFLEQSQIWGHTSGKDWSSWWALETSGGFLNQTKRVSLHCQRGSVANMHTNGGWSQSVKTQYLISSPSPSISSLLSRDASGSPAETLFAKSGSILQVGFPLSIKEFQLCWLVSNSAKCARNLLLPLNLSKTKVELKRKYRMLT